MIKKISKKIAMQFTFKTYFANLPNLMNQFEKKLQTGRETDIPAIAISYDPQIRGGRGQ